jgi:DNA-binding beta-propeller fold protein YncE
MTISLRNALRGLVALAAAAGVGAGGQASTPTLKKVAAFDLPGPGGKRFDYLTIDAADHYLISAHLGAGQTYAVDLRTNTAVATIGVTPGAEGVEEVPELRKLYTSNAGDNTIGVIDLAQSARSRRRSTPRRQASSASRPQKPRCKRSSWLARGPTPRS